MVCSRSPQAQPENGIGSVDFVFNLIEFEIGFIELILLLIDYVVLFKFESFQVCLFYIVLLNI